jgi:hypothetical protein
MAPTNKTNGARRLLADASASANTTTGCTDVLKHYAKNTQDFAAAAGLKHTSFYLTLRLGIPLEVGEAKSKLLAQVYQALSEFDAVKNEPSRRRAVQDFTYKTFNGHYTVTEVAEYDKCAPFATTAPTPNPSATQAPTAFPTPNATPVPTLAPTANTSAPTTAAPTNTSAPTPGPTPNPATMAPTSFVPTASPTFAPVQTFQCAQLNVTVYHPADAKYGTAFTKLKTDVTKDASDPVGKLAMNLKNAGVQIRVADTANADIQTYGPTDAPTGPTPAPVEEKKSSTTLIVVIVVIVVVVVVVVAAVAVSKKRATFQKSTERQAGIDL